MEKKDDEINREIDYDDIFVDRSAELNLLKKKLREVKDSKGETILIKGEVGIGKTYLVDRLKSYAEDIGLMWLQGGCVTREGASFHPFTQAFEEFMGEEESKRTNLPLGISIFGKKKGKNKHPGMFDSNKRTTLQQSVLSIKEIASDHPLVIFIEDLQWADKDSLLMLRYISARMEDEPILVLGTYRPSEASNYEFFKETIRYLSHRKLYTELELSLFNMEETKELIDEIIGKESPEYFNDMMYRRTEGNPLFIVETLNSMIANGVIAPSEDKYVQKPQEIEWPSVVEYSVERRIVRLDEETQNFLQYLSILGYEFSFSALTDFIDMDEMDILDYLDTLLERGILTETGSSEDYRFTHSAFRDVVYDSLMKGKRRVLHKRAAETLEDSRSSDDVKYHTDLAGHYKKAVLYSEYVDHSLSAAERAEEEDDYSTAVESYDEILEMADEIPSSDIDMEKLKFRYARALFNLAKLEEEKTESERYIETSIELFEQIDNTEWVNRCKESLENLKKG